MNHSISESLQKLFMQLGIDNKIQQYSLLDNWPSIVGSTIGNVTRAEKIENGTIFVKVKSASWRTELIYQKQAILSSIEKFTKKKVVFDIRFYL